MFPHEGLVRFGQAKILVAQYTKPGHNLERLRKAVRRLLGPGTLWDGFLPKHMERFFEAKLDRNKKTKLLILFSWTVRFMAFVDDQWAARSMSDKLLKAMSAVMSAGDAEFDSLVSKAMKTLDSMILEMLTEARPDIENKVSAVVL
jgi:hypothetical protein